jgi:hypothetical protein
LIRSPADRPNRRNTEYSIMLTAAPASTNILLTGWPFMQPLRYKAFKWLSSLLRASQILLAVAPSQAVSDPGLRDYVHNVF